MQLSLLFSLVHAFFFVTTMGLASGQTIPPGNSLVRTIFQFGRDMAAENLAMRPNGNILVTFTNVGEVWEVNPFTCSGQLLFDFPSTNSTSGIVEIGPDVFAIAAGVFNVQTLTGTLNTWAIYKIDYTSKTAVVTKIGDAPEATYINGVERLPNTTKILLAFSTGILPGSSVWSFDTATGARTSVITALNTFTGLAIPSFNGLKVRVVNSQTYLYFSNILAMPLFGRISIDPETGRPLAAVDSVEYFPNYPVFPRPSFADDFAFDKQSRVYLTTQTQNQLLRFSIFSAQSPIEVIAGGKQDPTIAGPSAARFGNLERNRDVLYLTLSGGNTNNMGPPIVGGRLVSIDTAKL